jgi:phosphoglycolate phosphatase
MKKAVLFDLDGTLLDTLGDLHAAVNHVLREFGYPQRSIEEVCRFVGNGAAQLIRLAVPEGVDFVPVLAAFQSYYAAHCDILTKPYDGVLDALAVLGQKYPLAVVSNKPDRAVKELAQIYFPGLYARGESTDCPRKPAPDMVRKALEAIGAERCVYVGDSDVDILTASNAGVPCLSVTWGFRGEEELLKAGAKHLCHDPADLPAIIQQIMKEM